MARHGCCCGHELNAGAWRRPGVGIVEDSSELGDIGLGGAVRRGGVVSAGRDSFERSPTPPDEED